MAQALLVCEYVSGSGLVAEPALQAQGLAMRDALLADLADVTGLQVAYLHGAGMPLAAHGQAVALSAGQGPADVLRAWARQGGRAWVVAPESDGCLAALAEAVGPVGWTGCEVDAIRLCASKSATLARLAARGIATPLGCADLASRWVVKPDDGAGSIDTRMHASQAAAQADLNARRAEGRAATLEPWVEGEALSLSVLAGAGAGTRVELLSVNRQRIDVDPRGVLAYTGVDILALGTEDARHPALRATAEAVVRAVPGLRGFFGIDLVWEPGGGPVVIEVNPRLTCAYVGLSAALGRNLAAEVLALHGEAAHAEA